MDCYVEERGEVDYEHVLDQVQQDPVTLYLSGLAPSGRRSMRSLLGGVVEVLGMEGPLEEMPWGELRYPQVAQVRSALLAKGQSPNTVNTALAALRGVLRAALHLGEFPAAEWLRLGAVKRVRGERVAGRGLKRREITALFKACTEERTVAGVRDAALIDLLVNAGLRRSEVVGLKVGDYTPRGGRLMVRAGKGRQERALVLAPGTRKQIAAWLRRRGREAGTLFCPIGPDDRVVVRQLCDQSVYDIVVRRAAQAGIEHCTPHDLRRTFVTRLLEQGVDLNTVRQLAGHRSVQTTVRYDRRGEQAQARALRSLS